MMQIAGSAAFITTQQRFTHTHTRSLGAVLWCGCGARARFMIDVCLFCGSTSPSFSLSASAAFFWCSPNPLGYLRHDHAAALDAPAASRRIVSAMLFLAACCLAFQAPQSLVLLSSPADAAVTLRADTGGIRMEMPTKAQKLVRESTLR